MNCTRCECTGFINIGQVDEVTLREFDASGDVDVVLRWIEAHPESDAAVCDCCGDGTGWYGDPGDHSHSDFGPSGPYGYNGGNPECS